MNAYLAAMRKYASFSGRSSRKDFWIYTAVIFMISVLAAVLDRFIGSAGTANLPGSRPGLFFTLWYLIHALPSLSLSVRRLHDTDRSGWWLLTAVTGVGNLVLMVFTCLRGTVGPNRYGLDPYARPNANHVEPRLADISSEASASSAYRGPDRQQQAVQQTVRPPFESRSKTISDNLTHNGLRNMDFDFRNAPRHELRKEYKRIAREIGDDQFFTKRELNHLPRILGEGEQVLAFTSGLMDGHTWLITLTDRRIVFLDKGLVYGLRQSSINLSKINAVSGETGMFFGKIFIEDGASQRVITNVWKKTVTTFTNKVRDALETPRPSVASRSRDDVSEVDVVSKLERLALLWDRGMLTEDEFLEQKVKIMRG